MPKARKLKSGSWHCKVLSHTEILPDGRKKRIYESFTVKDPSRAGKRLCEKLAADWADSRVDRHDDATVGEVIRKYIDMKERVLSPATIRGYENYYNSCYDRISAEPAAGLTAPAVQVWINELALEYKAKYIKNVYALFHASMSFYGYPELRVSLPTGPQFVAHVPCDEEIRKLISYLDHDIGRQTKRETKMAILLAAFGSLRRGEICALTVDDFDGCRVRVCKDIVMDKDGISVTKHTPKTDSSNRIVVLPQFVIDQLGLPDLHGRIIKATPEMISNRFRRAVRMSGADIPFRFHDLRHYYVSIAHALGIPDAYVMAQGGWSSDSVMKRVYRSALQDRAAIEQKKLNDHFSEVVSVG